MARYGAARPAADGGGRLTIEQTVERLHAARSGGQRSTRLTRIYEPPDLPPHIASGVVIGPPPPDALHLIRKNPLIEKEIGAVGGFCFGCLRFRWFQNLTRGHVFNKSGQKTPQGIPFLAGSWGDRGRLWVAFDVGAALDERQIYIIGTWDAPGPRPFNVPIRDLWVPLCEPCKKLESVPDGIAQQREIIKGASTSFTLRGLPVGAQIRAGTKGILKDWREEAVGVVLEKARFFLRMICLVRIASIHGSRPLRTLQALAARDPGRRTLKWDPGPPQVRLFDGESGTELYDWLIKTAHPPR